MKGNIPKKDGYYWLNNSDRYGWEVVEVGGGRFSTFGSPLKPMVSDYKGKWGAYIGKQSEEPTPLA